MAGRGEGQVAGARSGGASGFAGATPPVTHVIRPSALTCSPAGDGIVVHPDAGATLNTNRIIVERPIRDRK
eukprot:1409399-Alexandrium_andersonii.AAC.1